MDMIQQMSFKKRLDSTITEKMKGKRAIIIFTTILNSVIQILDKELIITYFQPAYSSSW